MKLATFRNGTRDGSLMVVSRDLTQAVRAESVVAGLRTLQQLLDDWPTMQLKLERIYAELNEAVDGRRPPPFEIVDFDAGMLHCTLAARLSVGRRIGLRQPRGAGAARARRRDAGELLDRAAHVPGRVRRLSGAVRCHRAGGGGLGHRPRGRDCCDHGRCGDGNSDGGGRRAHLPRSCWSTTSRCAT